MDFHWIKQALITIEEGAIGGFASHVMMHLVMNGKLDDGKLKVLCPRMLNFAMFVHEWYLS